jgi:hypothetical protein
MNYNPFCQAKQRAIAINAYGRRCFNMLCLTILLLWIFSSAAFAQSCPLYPSPHLRVGFNFAQDGGVEITDYDTRRLGAGWYHDYSFNQTPAHPDGILYHQMVRGAGRTTAERIQNLLNRLGPVVDANPGQVWKVGNEPDRYGQDQLRPEQYVVFYHHVYTFIKQRDPSSRVAVGGIMQPTPIRLRYLDQVLAIYQERYNQPLPADLWHIHNFLLPETCGWGGGLPPGLEEYASEGIPCPANLSEHGNLNTFKQQLRNFRQWMKNRGYQNYPLIVSEYGILLSKYHGFPHPVVRDFMLGSFDFMLNTTDAQTGYPADGNRLVQEFAWFSLNFYEFDLATYSGLNGNLFDHSSRQIMPLGLDFENYVKTITVKQTDLAMRTISYAPAQPQTNWPVTLTATFANQGSVAAQEATVRFWNGDPRAGGQLIGSAPPLAQLLPECTVPKKGTFLWTPTQPGVYTIFAELTAANSALETDRANNYASMTLTVGGTPDHSHANTIAVTFPHTVADAIAHTDAAAHSHSNGFADFNAITGGIRHTQCHPNSIANHDGHPHVPPNTNDDGYGNPNICRPRDSHPHNCNRNTHGVDYTNAAADSNRDSHPASKCDRNRNSNTNGNSGSNRSSHANSVSHTDGHLDAGA